MLSQADLAVMQATAVRSMLDICQVQTFGEVRNDWGEVTPTYTPGSSYACGLRTDLTNQETYTVDGVAFTVDAELRLPLAAWGAVTSRDRIRMTYRYGVAFASPISYAVMGEPQKGPTAVLLQLRQVS